MEPMAEVVVLVVRRNNLTCGLFELFLFFDSAWHWCIHCVIKTLFVQTHKQTVPDENYVR